MVRLSQLCLALPDCRALSYWAFDANLDVVKCMPDRLDTESLYCSKASPRHGFTAVDLLRRRR